MNAEASKLLKRIETKKARVGVIGLGYVGLPLVKTFLQKGFRVTGFDYVPIEQGLQLTDVIKRQSMHEVEARYAAPRPGDILHSTADISKARRLTGFAPGRSFMDGLRATVDWYKKRS